MKLKHSAYIVNQKAVKLVNRLEYELKKTKELADTQAAKSTEIIERIMLDLLRAEKEKHASEKEVVKTKEDVSMQWEILKSLFRSEKMSTSDLSVAGDRTTRVDLIVI